MVRWSVTYHAAPLSHYHGAPRPRGAGRRRCQTTLIAVRLERPRSPKEVLLGGQAVAAGRCPRPDTATTT